MTTTQYRIIQASDAGDLQDRVQKAIDEGWELQGGVSGFSTSGAYSSRYYMQSVVFHNK